VSIAGGNDSPTSATASVEPTYRIAEVYLFDTCTHRCGYCGLAESGQVLDASQLKPFRDPEFIRRVAGFFNRRTQTSTKWLLQFTGGEPLLTPGLELLCESLFEYGNRVAFYTALLLPEGHAGFRFLLSSGAPDVDYVMASFHPEAELDEEVYFRKIRLLKERGHHVIVRYVGHPARLSRLQEVDARCRDLDVCFYPTTLLSTIYPQAYTEMERSSLATYFTSMSQHLQLRGGLRTEVLRCHAGSRMIAVNMQTGNITPCITVDRPSLGNVFADTLNLGEGLAACPVGNISCVCDVHYQQAIVEGVDDSRAFADQKQGYVPWGADRGALTDLAHLPFYQGKMGIGEVQDHGRLFFTKEEVKARWQMRKIRGVGSLGEWSVSCSVADDRRAVISVRLRKSHPIDGIELFLNESADGSTDRSWVSVYTGNHSGDQLDLQVPVPLGARSPGRYRVALNVRFADGSNCYWYNQPPHVLQVTD
jgi:organic radical activating enzyme